MASLTPDEKNKIDYLLSKFKQKTLQREEALELQSLLEIEKDDAFKIGDFVLAMGAVFLLAALIGYLARKVDIIEPNTKVSDNLSVKKIPKKKSRKRLFSILY
jgi:hypothetical protein